MVVSMKITVFWDVAPCGLMMEAVRTSEMPIYFHETTHFYVPESFHLKDFINLQYIHV
jgi:hypothetical protein